MVILHVYGSGRSGTTLIGMLLAQIEGVFYAGELQPLWGPSWLLDELCSCGKPVLECPVWREVLNAVSQGRSLDALITEMRWLRDKTSRARHLILDPLLRRARTWRDLQEQFVSRTAQLYQEIQRVTGCRVIVDTSKQPSYSALMAQRSGLDWRVVHLVRDPRAIAHSWARRKAWVTKAGSAVRQQNALWSTLAWVIQNALVDVFRLTEGRFLRVRYEDFVHATDEELGKLKSFLGLEQANLTLRLGETLLLREHHILGANPDRLQRQSIRIAPDEEWRSQMSRVHKALVWALSAPVALRYGYKAGMREA